MIEQPHDPFSQLTKELLLRVAASFAMHQVGRLAEIFKANNLAELTPEQNGAIHRLILDAQLTTAMNCAQFQIDGKDMAIFRTITSADIDAFLRAEFPTGKTTLMFDPVAARPMIPGNN